MIIPGSRHISKPRLGAQLDRSHPATQGLMGCYLFNENSGNTCFDLAGTNHFTLNGGVSRVAMPGGQLGPGGISSQSGPAIQFDGSTGYAQSSSSYFSGKSQITVIIGLRFGTPGVSPIIEANLAYNAGILATVDSNLFSMYVGSSQPVNKQGPVLSTYPYVLAFSWSGSTSGNQTRLYTNGLMKYSAVSGAIATIPVHTAMLMGRYIDGSQSNNNIVGSLKMYNRILSPEEIAADYASPWEMFAPVNPRRFFQASAAIAPNLPPVLSGNMSKLTGGMEA